MLARSVFALRVFAAATLSFVLSQCATSGSSTTDGRATAQSGATPASTTQAAEDEVQILVDEAPGNRKGILFTIRSNLDKVVKISFPDGGDELELVKRVPGTATFVYDGGTKKTILEMNNGTTRKGPRVVTTSGSFNPILMLKQPRQQPLRNVPHWTRKLVVCQNYGIEFSFILSIQS